MYFVKTLKTFSTKNEEVKKLRTAWMREMWYTYLRLSFKVFLNRNWWFYKLNEEENFSFVNVFQLWGGCNCTVNICINMDTAMVKNSSHHLINFFFIWCNGSCVRDLYMFSIKRQLRASVLRTAHASIHRH